MRLSPYNVASVVEADGPRLPSILPHVFEQLRSPTIDPETLHYYCKAFLSKFQQVPATRPPSDYGLDQLAKASFQAGMIRTMLSVAQNTRPGSDCGLAAHFAIECLSQLITNGDMQERHEVLDELLEHDALNIFLDIASNHRYAICRNSAVEAMRTMSAGSFLGSRLSAAQTANIMTTMCRIILAGPQLFIDQMSNPSLVWQNTTCLPGPPNIATAARYAPRFFSMTTEKAVWVMAGLLCRDPPPTQQFCLKIIEHNPEIIDLLLQCAVVKRNPWYPDGQTDSVACEVLSLLTRRLFYVIPGIPVPDDEALKEQEAKEL
ncbi:hypothetical protein AX16_006729 [Volvariella volvacea WC 439]|nr:hypothetical protein AX16_006729 [Volvariella volvacea WC 439]